jgi:hypothetical protein
VLAVANPCSKVDRVQIGILSGPAGGRDDIYEAAPLPNLVHSRNLDRAGNVHLKVQAYLCRGGRQHYLDAAAGRGLYDHEQPSGERCHDRRRQNDL